MWLDVSEPQPQCQASPAFAHKASVITESQQRHPAADCPSHCSQLEKTCLPGESLMFTSEAREHKYFYKLQIKISV